MRTTLALDDELIEKAQAYTGLTEKSALVREALKALSARRRGDWRGLAVRSLILRIFRGGDQSRRDPRRYLRLDWAFPGS
jgi:hypothetical protein